MYIRFDNSKITRIISDTIIERLTQFHKPEGPFYSIRAVSETMNKSRQYVVSVLKRKNFNINRGFSTPLDEEMLNVLADDYVNTQHLFFNQAIKGLVKKPEKKQHFLSFRKLFKHDDYTDIEYAESWKQIDEDMIRQTFIYGVNKHMSSNNGQQEAKNNGLITGKSYLTKIYSSMLAHCKLPEVQEQDCILGSFCVGQDCIVGSLFGGETLLSLQEEYPVYTSRKQTELDYKLYVLNQLTSSADPTSVKSKLLTPLTQRASSGFFVRHVLLPHRYCIFGTSNDDDHESTLYFSECKPDYMNCYTGWGNAIMLPCAV